MKRLFIFILCVLPFIACEKDNDEQKNGKINESISMGENYVNDIYYSLDNGLVASVPRDNWDIAFNTSARSSSIITNCGTGVELYVQATTESWTWGDQIDTTGMSLKNFLVNSDTIWENGAFSRNATGHPHYGWGVYDMTTHNLTGVTLYIVKTVNDQYKQIWIEKKQSTANVYDFRFADIDGSNEQVVSIDCNNYNTKNFIYYNLESNQVVDREPAKDTWDIVFTKYYNETINYLVTGVLSNIDVKCAENREIDPGNAVFDEFKLESNISIIGSDWKEFDMGTYTYTLIDNLSYFVKDLNEDVYKIVFTAFEGSTNGNLGFDKTKIN
jgi:hypothetical protein